MAYGPSGGWFGPTLGSIGSSEWWLPLPTISIPNPIAQIMLTQCNASLVPSSNSSGFPVGIAIPGAFQVISPSASSPLVGDPSSSTSLVGVAGECLGDAVAQRVALGTAMYFLLLAPLSAASPELHRSFWAWKILLHVALVLTALFMPAEAGEPWAGTTRGIAGLFLVAQVLVMVDLAFNLHDWLILRMIRRYEDLQEEYQGAENQPGFCANQWQVVYALLALALWIGSATTVIGLAVMESHAGPRCAGGTAAMAACLLLAIVYTVASLLDCLAPASGSRGALPPAIVFAYCTWLLVSALGSLHTECAALPTAGHDGSATSITVSVAIAALSLGYTAYSASSSVPGLFNGATPEPGYESSGLLRGANGSESEGDDDHDGDDSAADGAERGGRVASAVASRGTYGSDDADADGESGSGCCSGDARSFSWLFHLVMVTAAVYMGAVLTGWQVPGRGQFTVDNSSGELVVQSQQSIAAFWAQTLAALVAVALYGWILVAELACPGRTFGPS